MPAPLFNVLTRVSRPRYFATCRESVVTQLHPHVRQIVSIDSDRCLGAVEGLPTVRVERGGPERGTFPFNLYFNELYREVQPGWVVFLDDDDVFTSPWALSDLAAQIERDGSDPDVMYLWKVWFPEWNTVIPRRSFGREPTECDINTSGACFHSKHLTHATWDGNKVGDYRVLRRLWERVPRAVWLDRVFVAQQDVPHFGDLADQDGHVVRPADHLGRLGELVAARDESLRQAEAAALAGREVTARQVAALTAELAEARTALAAAADEAARGRAALAALELDRNGLEKTLQERSRDLDAVRARLARLEAEQAKTRTALEQARAEAAEVRNSKSWRWLRPVREARGFLRRHLR